MSSRTRTDRVDPLIVGAIVVAVFCAVRRPFPVGVAQDDGLYVVLAKALASGRGLRFINLPGAPADVHYPPGYPLLLALFWRLGPSFTASALIASLANIALLGGASAGFVLLARRVGMPRHYAIIGALVGFLMPPALWMGTALLSEPLWLALTFWWLLRAEAAGEGPSAGATNALWLGMASGAIMLVRTQAVSGLVALVCVLAWRRRGQAALLVLAGALLFAIPWQLWVAAHAAEIPPELSAKYGPYASWYVAGWREAGFDLVIGTLRRNLLATMSIVGGMFALPTASWFGVALLVAPATAAVPRLVRKAPVTLILIAVHAAIVVLWPFEPRRFVWTSWPFIALWLAAGIAELHDRVARRRGLRAAVAADAVLLGVGATLTTAIILRTGAYRAIAASQARRIEASTQWTRQHAAAGAVVASEDETAVFLYTGHVGVPTATFGAAAYAKNDSTAAPIFPDILRRYAPDVAIISLTTTVTSALELTRGQPPLLQLADRAGPSLVFVRLGSRAVRD